MDANDKFRKSFESQGVDPEKLIDFDLDSLDYVEWGNSLVAFPNFFDITYPETFTGYAYTGWNGEEGARVSELTFSVGSPDPRNPTCIVTRLLQATDLNGIDTVLVELQPTEEDTVLAKLEAYIHIFNEVEPLVGLLAQSFGTVNVNVVDFENCQDNFNWTVHKV